MVAAYYVLNYSEWLVTTTIMSVCTVSNHAKTSHCETLLVHSINFISTFV